MANDGVWLLGHDPAGSSSGGTRVCTAPARRLGDDLQERVAGAAGRALERPRDDFTPVEIVRNEDEIRGTFETKTGEAYRIRVSPNGFRVTKAGRYGEPPLASAVSPAETAAGRRVQSPFRRNGYEGFKSGNGMADEVGVKRLYESTLGRLELELA